MEELAITKLADMVVLQEVMDEMCLYVVTFDRAGYGESDPNPKRNVKSEAFDIQEGNW